VAPGHDGIDDPADHSAQIVVVEPSAATPHQPQVELMRSAGVQPVDRVSPVTDAGQREQHLGRRVLLAGEPA
jgi:hypothetical protein